MIVAPDELKLIWYERIRHREVLATYESACPKAVTIIARYQTDISMMRMNDKTSS
jgi:hypothetical protein